jgi:hypothetical protein
MFAQFGMLVQYWSQRSEHLEHGLMELRLRRIAALYVLVERLQILVNVQQH